MKDKVALVAIVIEIPDDPTTSGTVTLEVLYLARKAQGVQVTEVFKPFLFLSLLLQPRDPCDLCHTKHMSNVVTTFTIVVI